MAKETKRTEEFRFDGDKVWAKIKNLVKEGNIRHLVFKKKNNETIASMTLTIATILLLIAPQIVVIVILIALFMQCSLVIEKENEETHNEQ